MKYLYHQYIDKENRARPADLSDDLRKLVSVHILRFIDFVLTSSNSICCYHYQCLLVVLEVEVGSSSSS